jgi:hypothetical protein
MPALALSILKAIGIRGALAIGLAIALLVTGLRLNHAKHDLTNARAEITRLNTSLESLRRAVAASEGNRDTEYAEAKSALTEAETDCRARIEQARKTQRVIRSIVERPVPVNAAGCPVPDRVSAGELRSAIGAPNP